MPRWTLKKEPKRRETARERARATSTSVGRPVPCLWRRQPRPPAAVPARYSCVRDRRKCKEECICPVAEEGSGVSHAAVGRAHMRTSLDMYTLCAHECFEHGYIFVHIKVYIYTHTYICIHMCKYDMSVLNIDIHLSTYMYAYIYVHIKILMYTYIYLHAHIYTYTYNGLRQVMTPL